MAIDVDRYRVRNENGLNQENLTEERESELDDFIEYSKLVLGVLGYKLFVPLVESTVEENEETAEENGELMLYLSRKMKKSNKTIEAKCMKTDKGFIVLKDSMIEEIDLKSIPESIKVIRRKCRRKNKIADGRITGNYLFTSPSSAASFVLGMNTNGRTDWKTEDGLTLNELEAKGFI